MNVAALFFNALTESPAYSIDKADFQQHEIDAMRQLFTEFYGKHVDNMGTGFNFWKVWKGGGMYFAMRFTWDNGLISGSSIEDFSNEMRKYHKRLSQYSDE